MAAGDGAALRFGAEFVGKSLAQPKGSCVMLLPCAPTVIGEVHKKIEVVG